MPTVVSLCRKEGIRQALTSGNESEYQDCEETAFCVVHKEL